MKLFKIALVSLLVLINLVLAPPSWADRPKLTQGSDYTEVMQAIDKFLKAKETPDQSDYAPEEIEQRLGELQLQKYILETAQDWSQCHNETGKTLGIYAHKPKKSAQEPSLYFLGKGQITEDEWNCDGVYLPSGTKIAGQELTEPVAIKFVDGTQLVAKVIPETGALEFNAPPAKVFRAGEANWSIPNLSLADIDVQVLNAPIED